MKKYLIFLTILLIGCTTTEHVPTEEIPIPLAKMPSPVYIADISWRVVDGKVALTTEDGVKLNLQVKDTIRYIKDLKNVICYYEDKHNFCKEKDASE